MYRPNIGSINTFFYFPFFKKKKVLPGIFFKIPLAIQWYREEIPTTSRPAGENIKSSRKL